MSDLRATTKALVALAGLLEANPAPSLKTIAERAGIPVSALRPGTLARYAIDTIGRTAKPNS